MISLLNHIRQFFCKPLIKKVTQFLHMRGFMRRVFYLAQPLALPKNRKKCYSLDDIRACFYINTPLGLHVVETPLLDSGPGGEREILSTVLNNLNPGDIAFDIGANVGVYTVFMAKKVGANGRIVAFEPQASNFETLKDNINLNGLKNVILMQIALGDIVGEGILYGVSVLSSLMRSPEEKSGQKVNIIPGDHFVQNGNLPLPNIIKIDVEGYEYNVIQGLRKTMSNDKCQIVFCEIHPTLLPPDIKPQMIVESLQSFGFNRIRNYPSRGEIFSIIGYKKSDNV